MPALEALRKKLIEELSGPKSDDRGKKEIEIKVDIFLSSVLGGLSLNSSDKIWKWFLEKRDKSDFRADIVPVREARGWSIDPVTGNISHSSGKFFSVKGISVSSGKREKAEWCQPIIDQPEIGVLGFLVKKINGIYHFLVQAKEEPGNIGGVQLTTTLMATRSNLEKVHGGKGPLFAEYFKDPAGRMVLVNKLQSEEGARFYKKNNLNIVIELNGDEDPVIPDMFMWMSLYQIKELLKHENVVNACARSVIACLP